MAFTFSDCNIRVTAPPVRRYHGRRARRQAFYERQRLARLISRLAREVASAGRQALEQAMLDTIAHGTGVVEVKWDRGDGDGFTSEPVRDGEWPRAMLRVRYVPFEAMADDAAFAPAWPKE